MTDKQKIVKKVALAVAGIGTNYAIGTAINMLVPIPDKVLVKIIRYIGTYALAVVISSLVEKQMAVMYDEFYKEIMKVVEEAKK